MSSRAIPRRRRIMAGKNTIHGAESITGRASERIAPRDGSGTSTPHPRYESVDSAMTADRNTDTPWKAR